MNSPPPPPAPTSEADDSHCQRSRESGSCQQDRQKSHVRDAMTCGHNALLSTHEAARRDGLSVSICQSRESDTGTLLLNSCFTLFLHFTINPGSLRSHRACGCHASLASSPGWQLLQSLCCFYDFDSLRSTCQAFGRVSVNLICLLFSLGHGVWEGGRQRYGKIMLQVCDSHVKSPHNGNLRHTAETVSASLLSCHLIISSFACSLGFIPLSPPHLSNAGQGSHNWRVNKEGLSFLLHLFIYLIFCLSQ